MKAISYSYIGNKALLKLSAYLKQYEIQCNANGTVKEYYIRILNFLQNYKRPWVTKQFCKNGKSGGIICPDFKLYYIAILN